MKSLFTADNITTYLTGLIFSLGLCLSGMMEPSKVVGFLDIAGNWDPSLGMVMFGAISVYFTGQRLILKTRTKPVYAVKYGLPTRVDIDGRLVTGAILFGIGWGLAGFCPGPALASMVTFDPNIYIFIISMTLGMYVYGTLDTRFTAEPDGGAGVFEVLASEQAGTADSEIIGAEAKATS